MSLVKHVLLRGVKRASYRTAAYALRVFEDHVVQALHERLGIHREIAFVGDDEAMAALHVDDVLVQVVLYVVAEETAGGVKRSDIALEKVVWMGLV